MKVPARVLWVLSFSLLALLFGLPRDARAERPSATGPHYLVTGSWIHREYGGEDEAEVEGQFEALIPLFSEHAFEIGPRLGVLRALSGPAERTDFSLGAESVLWIVNLIGPGVAVDWITGTEDAGTHARIEPYASLRLMHVLTEGALSVRLGMPYETTKAWGLRLGISLQFDGVPRASYEE